jgi:hypothetical protein
MAEQADFKFVLNKDVFWTRLGEIYASWKKGDKMWKGK